MLVCVCDLVGEEIGSAALNCLPYRLTYRLS